MSTPNSQAKLYQNLWHHNGQYFAFLTPSDNPASIEEGMSYQNAVTHFPVAAIQPMVANLDTLWVPGLTLLVDFPFPAFHDNLGHYAELLFPLYSLLLESNWREGSVLGPPVAIQRVFFSNLLVKDLPDWALQCLAEVLAPALPPHAQPDRLALPPMVDMQALTEFAKKGYVGFEEVLVMRDRYTHPDRTQGYPTLDHGDAWRKDGAARYVDANFHSGFARPEHAAQLRQALLKRLNWPQTPQQRVGVRKLPRVITLLTPDSGDVVVNVTKMLDLLWSMEERFGWQVRPASLARHSNLAAHVGVMQRTGILITRHCPLLASALFLPKGALILELLPYNWEWQNMSQLYVNMTSSMGTLHHQAWRPYSANYTTYAVESDANYKDWNADECSSRECLVAHARAGLSADVEWLRAKLEEVIPKLEAGVEVGELQGEWPEVH